MTNVKHCVKTALMVAFVFVAVSCVDKGKSTLQGVDPYFSADESGSLIVVDQFGYWPHMKKIAVLRDPQIGFDAEKTYTPSPIIELVNKNTGQTVLRRAQAPWNAGAIDESSGDRVWWFDFSDIQTQGEYFVRDAEQGVLSPTFAIIENPYKNVLKQAFRTFFYQRAGFAKKPPFAEPPWADEASHLGPLQDSEARLFSDPENAKTERDLSGGWYDAGDYNKYTNWTANYVIDLLHAYQERPQVWGDDFNIPESGNGVPDILDEVKWGLDFLQRMQNEDGAVLSIVGLSSASPPSAAQGPSLYGPPNTSATLTSAAAFALSAKIYASIQNGIFDEYSEVLVKRAELAWLWATENPAVIFKNNDETFHSKGLGAGQQEVDDETRLSKKIESAIYLFELTQKEQYKKFVEDHYQQTALFKSLWSNPFRARFSHMLLYFAQLKGVDQRLSTEITTRFMESMNAESRWGTLLKEADPYRAYLGAYTWGSSGIKADLGNLFYEQILFGIGAQAHDQVYDAAARYIHYLHGTNPLAKVYLSNMGAYGAENSVDQFYHTWFSHGSQYWDGVRESKYGPPPGFLVGGANPNYDWDSCCPSACGHQNNGSCFRFAPPYQQPKQKSYRDFNESWPINSWSVTENSNGYQVRYLRLLSKFVD